MKQFNPELRGKPPPQSGGWKRGGIISDTAPYKFWR